MTRYSAVSQTTPVRVPSPVLLLVAWVIWLPFLVEQAVNLAMAHPSARLLAMAMTLHAVFLAAYVGSTWRVAWDFPRFRLTDYGRAAPWRWGMAAALLCLSVAIGLMGRGTGVELMSPFIYTCAFVAGAFRPVRAIEANAVVLAVCLIVGHLVPVGDWEQGVFLVVVVTFMTVAWTRSIVTTYELRATQEELTGLAITSERLRIARDLHDLLGHRLSLVTLKSELARRVLATDPERAAGEMAEVEAAARLMLQEVREAVSRYRTPRLVDELAAAAEVLSAAGIELTREGDAAPAGLSPPLDEVMAWTVREGVTNVIRHSGAAACTIRVRREPGAIAVEITDNGVSVPAGTAGAGIAGLTERARVLGGHCEAGRCARGGFRLAVTVPVGAGA